ncbi:hypothetical protein TrRE_jg2475 [Triparma retinervis]|uniref:Methyltransferase type 12 domain-containing protein n=1 Tax=Triparma retinervis TaxID=2557542 RepID=A0A9W6ZPP2_9STRA|nr:hypothetical protein TrRE_jg2475 [Triparma retinervis]
MFARNLRFGLLRGSEITFQRIHRVPTRGLSTNQPPKLDNPDYWTSFYQRKAGAPFDWFVDDAEVIQEIAEHVRSMTQPSSRSSVLHIGCGTSILSEALFRETTLKLLLHTDIDETAVRQTQERLGGAALSGQGHRVEVDDILNSKFCTHNFDVVVDKGVVDCFVHSGNDEALKQALDNIKSALSPTGKLVMVTNDDYVMREGDFIKLGLMRDWDVPRMKSVELVGEETGFACNMFTISPRDKN